MEINQPGEFIDELDRQIILELKSNTRQSNRKIGRKLQSNEETIAARIKRLQQNNLFKLNGSLVLESFGFNFSCFIGLNVNLNLLTTIEKDLSVIPNILYISKTTGRNNLMLMATFHNVEEYRVFMKDVVYKLPGIKKEETFINWEVVKNSWVNGLDDLL
jgi:Lrp/AsnC family transcriptional regulator, leucine-responsive regulatory protein